jgi:hypothetical protein
MKLQLKDFERGISKYWEVVNSRSGCVQDTETEFPKFAGIYLWLPVVIVSSFLAGTLVGTGRAQTSPRKPPKYIQVDSMKVQPANEDDYVKVEQGGKGGVETDPPGADQARQASFLVLLRSGLSVRDGDQVQRRHREHL